MIKLIIGKKGSGKTKLLIDKVNTAVQNTNGNYDIKEIFIDGILKIGEKAGAKDYEGLGALLEKLYKQIPSDVTLVFTVSADQTDLPDSVLKFS